MFPINKSAQITYRIIRPPQNKAKREVWRLFWFAISLQMFLALFSYSPEDPAFSTWSSSQEIKNLLGKVGSIESDLLYQIFGLGSYVLVFLIMYLAFKPFSNHGEQNKKPFLVSLGFLVSFSSLIEAMIPSNWTEGILVNPGGYVGYGLWYSLNISVGKFGAISSIILLFIASSILLFEWPFFSWIYSFIVLFKSPKTIVKASDSSQIFDKKAEILNTPTVNSDKPLIELISRAKEKKVSVQSKKLDGDIFELPPISLLRANLKAATKPLNKNWYIEKSRMIIEKLNDFGVQGEITNICPGPVITVYEFKPASGVKIKEIANLSDDLTLALSVLSVRIVAPIPGKSVIGIEVPSLERETVYFRELMEEVPFYDKNIKIPILLGRLASGEPVIADLSSMPHLLVAGATGTGKSVFVNSLIMSLLFRFTPKELRLILVDPKMVELSHYEDTPHLLLPVVVDSKIAAQALRWTVAEMERRYRILHSAGVRHIDAYNDKLCIEESNERLPYVVVIIDEYADLMAVVPKDVELSIARLAQKARASGIHLVLATQRPSTDVVTGTIKANFTSRISFRVASAVDSKTILDRSGAERLLGSGDMLFHSPGFSMLKRMQGAYISDDSIEKVVEFLKSQGSPLYDEKILETETNSEANDLNENNEKDELYNLALKLVTEKGEASISLIQRSLKIGYNRAANLMDELEKNGVVGPAQSSATKRREVLIDSR